jgi:hypothetical protein
MIYWRTFTVNSSQKEKIEAGFITANAAKKWVGVEINAERPCQNLGPFICFTDSVKLMHHELQQRDRTKLFTA